ncbi:MAG: acylphosphatase [Terriglobia bacterium]
MGTEQARRFIVEGSVQGVGFRYFVERIAHELGLGGYVRNLPDGRVEVYALGPAGQVELLKARLTRGPRLARVRAVREEEAEALERYRGRFCVEF